jgi:hypothetical protein
MFSLFGVQVKKRSNTNKDCVKKTRNTYSMHTNSKNTNASRHDSEFTCIVIELLPAAILGTRATGVGAEGALLAELGGITVRRGTEERPLGTTGIT